MRHVICSSSDIDQGAARAFNVGGENILVFHLSDGFYATQSKCTHVFAPLKRGKIINDKCIQCPLHRARFDIRSGEVDEWANFPPGIQLLNTVRKEKALKTWPVIEEDGKLVIEL